MTTLRSTQPHFVRCIIPNELKQPGKYQHLSNPPRKCLTCQISCVKIKAIESLVKYNLTYSPCYLQKSLNYFTIA